MDREPKIESQEHEKKTGKDFEYADIINLQQVEISHEDENSYIVKFGEEEFEVIKSDETYFEPETKTTSEGGLRLRHVLALNIGGIFHDQDVPKEFTEVMIFHEIREREYKAVGFEDAHSRAINDEILYALKFLSADMQKDYFQFASERREQARLEGEKKKREEIEQQIIDKKHEEEKEARKIEEAREEIRLLSIAERVKKELGIPEKLSPEQKKSAKEIWFYISGYLLSNIMNLSLGIKKEWSKLSVFQEEKVPQNLQENDIYKMFKSKILSEINSVCEKGKPVENDSYGIWFETSMQKSEMEILRARLKVFYDFIQKH